MVFNDLEAFDRQYYEVECQSYIFKTVFCNQKSELQAFRGLVWQFLTTIAQWLKETGCRTTVFVVCSYRVSVIIFMKIHSTFLYLGFSVAAASSTLSYAQQVNLPAWLQPTWIKAKLTDLPVKNSDRYEVAQQATVVTNNGMPNPLMNPPINPPTNQQFNQQTLQPSIKQTASLAPVETAVPKLNEKHLTADELKELRKQLRQQR